MVYDDIIAALKNRFDRASDSFGMLVLELPVDNVLPAVNLLRTDFGFELLLDITAIDYPERTPRFDVVWHFYSRTHNRRVRLKASVSVNDPVVPTMTTRYGAARFHEREVHDMYGITFDGNADLRPILLYEGFVGHPLRKDYDMEAEQPIVPYRT